MLIVWVVLALLVAMAAVTWWQPSRFGPAVGLTGVAPLLYLAAWPCAVVAALGQDWPALAVALGLLVSQLVFALPSMRPWSTAKASAGPWRLTAYVHNVLYTNLDLTAVGEQIAEEAPDVVALIELSHENADSIRATNALLGYEFHAERLSHGGSGCAIWSKLPMTDATFGTADEHSIFSATLQPDGHPPVTLLVIHTTAPISTARSAAWAADLDAIATRVRATDRSLVLAGDFNATLPMRRLRRVARAGRLRDAGTTAGQGWRMTWPAGWRRIPGLMRLDHLLHSADLTVTDYHLGGAAGSDHLPLIVTLGVADRYR